MPDRPLADGMNIAGRSETDWSVPAVLLSCCNSVA